MHHNSLLFIHLSLASSMSVYQSPHHHSSLPLRFVPLKEAYKHLQRKEGFQSAGNESQDLTDEMIALRSSAAALLDKEKWLLAADQRIELPSTSLDFSKAMFSLNDFVVRAEEAIQKDLTAAAFDDEGRQRILTVEQESELRQRGQLSVPSVLIKNQVHTWKVAPWFYSGRETIQNSFWGGIGAGLDHFLEYAMWSDSESISWVLPSWTNSVRQGFRQAFELGAQALRQLISAPIRPLMFGAHDINRLVDIAEYRYVYHHLENQGYDTRRLWKDGNAIFWDHLTLLEDELAPFWDHAAEYYRPSSVSWYMEVEAAAKLIDFETEQHEAEMTKRRENELDYSSANAMESPLSARNEAVRAEAAWHEKAALELIDYFRSLDGPLFRLEASRLEAQKVEEMVAKSDEEKLQQLEADHETKLKEEAPFLSLSKTWLKRSLRCYRSGLKAELDASRAKRVIIVLEKHHGEMGLEVELEQRNLRVRFQDEEEQTIRLRLARQRQNLTVNFSLLQLNPQHWSVDESTNCINRYRKVEVKLDQWFWRFPYMWFIFLESFLTLTGSSFQFFSSGPLSLRALAVPNAFFASKRPSISVPGNLESDPASLTPTLASRLRSFNDALERDRAAFEAKPDVGLIGKSVQRVFFKINAIIKEIVGSLMITSFMLVGSILCTFVTGCTLLISPVLALLFTMLLLCRDFFLYDGGADAAGSALKLLGALYCLLVPGIAQGLLATVRCVFIHPTLGTVQTVWSTARFCYRTMRDALMGCILFRVAKIPVVDTFLAKRIHGPGLSSLHYLRLPLAAAKTSVELALLQTLVNAHVNFRMAELQVPSRRYVRYIDTLLRPFGFTAALQVKTPEQICQQLLLHVAKHQRSIQKLPLQSAAPAAFQQGGVWEQIGNSIRCSHPDIKLFSSVEERSAKQVITRLSVEEYDAQIQSLLQSGTALMLAPVTAYDVMSIRTGHILADLNLRRQFRGKPLLVHGSS
jgi:hypothetical protein